MSRWYCRENKNHSKAVIFDRAIGMILKKGVAEGLFGSLTIFKQQDPVVYRCSKKNLQNEWLGHLKITH